MSSPNNLQQGVQVSDISNYKDIETPLSGERLVFILALIHLTIVALSPMTNCMYSRGASGKKKI